MIKQKKPKLRIPISERPPKIENPKTAYRRKGKYPEDYLEDLEIKCNMCNWHGYEDQLPILKDENGHFKGCPNCQTDAYLMDIESWED